ncbi:MAG: recombinase RecT [Candidatus Dormibacteraeota bacterium]|nr:recombinase RecT [Candidatus Dormibacteraeota bacterium]
MTNTPVRLPSERAAAEQQQLDAAVHRSLEMMKPEIQRALPRGLDADRIARLAYTVVKRNPKLARATPSSFAGALLTAAALGLEPGVDNQAHLVPYEDHRKNIVECQLVIGYEGFAKLFNQHPRARTLDAQVVYAADKFDFAYGTNGFLTHRPALVDDEDRGQIVAYYAIAKMTNGAEKFLVLTPGQVRRLRQGRVGPKGDIADPEHWMERKTVVRQLIKMLPKSTRMAEALEVDEQPGSELRARLDTQTVIDGPAAATPQAAAGPASPPEVDGEAGMVEDARRDPPPDLAPDPGEAVRRPETATAPPARPASKAKTRLVQARLDALGVEDNPEERGYVLSTLLHRPIDPAAPLEKQLTGREADTLRDTLNDCDTKADLWEQLDRIEQGGEAR